MSTPPLDTLLAHTDWVRKFAASLVLDPARADDVAQETWLRVLEAPPEAADNVRGWLAAVARNTARSFGRSESRRARRERENARGEAQPDTSELLQRAALQRDLVDELMKLDDPYRETLLLRYFEGLPPREISRRLGRPVNTVRTHVQRGLEQLRETLDSEHESREAWCLALLPLARPSSSAVAHGSFITSLGGIVVLLKFILPLGLIALATSWWLDRPEHVESLSPIANGVGEERAELEAPADSLVHTGGAENRTAEVVDVADAVPADEAAPITVPIHGRAVGIDGTPLAGVTFVWISALPFREQRKPTAPRGTSAGDGTFVVETAGGRGELELASDELHLLVSGIAVGREDLGRLFVVVPTVEIAGVVVDEQDEPVAGARVNVFGSTKTPPGFPYLLNETDAPISWLGTETDDAGHFRLAGVPSVRGARVNSSTQGAHASIDVPALSRDDLKIVLEDRFGRHLITGEVRTPDGLLCPNASVFFLQDSTRTDTAGRFEIEVFNSSPDENARLVAWKEEHQPGIVEGLSARWNDDPEAGLNQLLVLGEAPLEITGRVLGQSGEPLQGFSVALIDGVALGTSDTFVESRISGRSGGTSLVGTGTDGAFRIGGLSDRNYRLRAYHRDTLLTLESEPIPAGTTDVELRFEGSSVFPLLRGRVVDRNGRAVEGVTVGTSLTHFENDLGMRSSIGGSTEATTDEHGRFELKDVPRQHVRLAIAGGFIERLEAEIPADVADAGDFRIEVVRLLHFQLRVSPDEPGRTGQVIGGDGEAMNVTILRPGVTVLIGKFKLHDESSPTFHVPDTASELLIRDKDGRELRRVPLVVAGDPRELQIVSL